jgi:hypothetical protein
MIDRLQKRYVMSFWLHLAQTLHHLSQKVVCPLALWTLLLEFRGLSRVGKTMLNYSGLAPSVRTVDTLKGELLMKQSADLQFIVDHHVFICALDNYTHVYGSPSISMNRDTQYHNPLFSVVAVVELTKQFASKFIAHAGSYFASLPPAAIDLKANQQEVRLPFISDS